MLNPYLNLNLGNRFENCGACVRIASVEFDIKDLSSWTSAYVADSTRSSEPSRTVATSKTTLISKRSNNTQPTLHALTAGSVRIKKRYRYEKRNVNQLVAVRRMSDCNR